MGHQRLFPCYGSGYAADRVPDHKISYHKIVPDRNRKLIAGLLLGIFAENFALMMAGRILQACGNSIVMSAAQVVILTVYRIDKKGTMMGSSVMMPLYVQNVMGYSTVVSSLVTLPGSAALLISNRSQAVYGENALMHGMNVSFLWMAVGSMILLLISILGTKGRSYITRCGS